MMKIAVNRKLDRTDLVLLIISYIIRASLVVVIFENIFQKNYFGVFMTIATLVMTFIPALISKNFKIKLPTEFEFITTIFIYASMFLGSFKNYYAKFWWWDMFLHGLSGIVLGMIGFMIVYMLYSQKKVEMSPFFVALFTLSFAISIGVLWEFYEFGGDQLFGMDMQRGSLVDTMADLILDAVGGLFAAVIGYFYVKKKDFLRLNGYIRKLIQNIVFDKK